MISHWDEVESAFRERGHIAGSWQPLTGNRSVTVGVRRVRIPAGRWATPLHRENSEEKIFYVLSGSGISLQWDGETTEAFEVGPGDCLVHLASEHGHTLCAGVDGVDVLAFGERHYPMDRRCCRARVSRGDSGRGRGPARRKTIPGSGRPKRASRRFPSSLRAAGPDR